MTHVELGEDNGTIVISKSSSAQAKNKGLLVWKVRKYVMEKDIIINAPLMQVTWRVMFT